MIRKSLFTGLFLLAAYSLLIYRYGPYVHRTAQTTGQRNLVKAEEYMFEQNQTADTVILGSSMSERIVFSNQCANLAMPGFSAHEGLELLLKSPHMPRVALVEINTLDRRSDMAFLHEVLDPTYRRTKTFLPFLRQKYQPVGVLKALLRDWQTGGDAFVIPGMATAIDTALREKAIADHLQANRTAVADTVLMRNLNLFRHNLETLRQRGVRVIFYEVPVDYRLQHNSTTCVVRAFVQREFPQGLYAHVSLPASKFETSDGIHLTVNEMPRFAHYLHETIQTLAVTTAYQSAKQQ